MGNTPSISTTSEHQLKDNNVENHMTDYWYHLNLNRNSNKYVMSTSTDPERHDYDNPAFRKDEAQNNHTNSEEPKKFIEPEEPNLSIKAPSKKRTSLLAIGVVFIVIAYLAVVLSLCLYFLVFYPKKLGPYTTNEFDGKVTVIKEKVAPPDYKFHIYDERYADSSSSAFNIYATLFESEMDSAFQESSKFSSKYKETNVTELRNGSVIVIFKIYLNQQIDANSESEDLLEKVVLDQVNTAGRFGRYLYIKKDTLEIKAVGGVPKYIPPPPLGSCRVQTLEYCSSFYKNYSLPNYYGHEMLIEVERSSYPSLLKITSKCDANYNYFVCALFFPQCSGNDTVGYNYLPPCQNLCQSVKDNCEFFTSFTNFEFPNCTHFPNTTDPSICSGGDLVNKVIEKPLVCKADQTKCADGKFCVPNSWLCDSYQDCEDNSDEQNCAKCPSNQYKCTSDQCIISTKLCDGARDCYLGQDEDTCIQLTSGGINYGEVQVKQHTQDWKTMCSDNWDQKATDLVCKNLYLSSTSSYTNETTPSETLTTTLKSEIKSTDIYLASKIDFSGTCQSNKAVTIQCGPVQCGTTPARYPMPIRVVGGIDVKPGTWPFMAAIYVGKSKIFLCGASLINEDWVLTAAHCIGNHKNQPLIDIYVRFGNVRRQGFSADVQEIMAVRAFTRSDYRWNEFPNDIALLKLEKSVTITNYVRPVCLPAVDSKASVGTRCFTTGFGVIDLNNQNTLSEFLKEVDVNIFDLNECKQIYEREEPKLTGTIKSHHLCAAGDNWEDACKGDSGSPLFCKLPSGQWYQEAIVLGGISCGQKSIPGIYTAVGPFKNWIEDTIKNN